MLLKLKCLIMLQMRSFNAIHIFVKFMNNKVFMKFMPTLAVIINHFV